MQLEELAAKAKAAFEALSPEEQEGCRRAQARSWVIGEVMHLNPRLTREEAERMVVEAEGRMKHGD